jgi:hypothetical protein
MKAIKSLRPFPVPECGGALAGFAALWAIVLLTPEYWRLPRSKSKCNKFRELIHRDSRRSAVEKWETLFVFHLFHGFFRYLMAALEDACCTWSLKPPLG